MNNNARTTIVGNPSASDISFVCKAGEGALFPSVFPYFGTIEHFSSGVVTKREIVTVTGRTGDVFTVTRASQICVQDESASTKTRTQQAYSFIDGDFFSQYFTENDLNTINAELNTNIPADLSLKADKDGIQNQTYISGTSTGSANAYVLTITPAITAYASQQKFCFKANFTNTGTCTINVNGKGAKTIKKLDGATNLSNGDIVSGQEVEVIYDGTNFQMVSPLGQSTQNTSTLTSTFTAGENMSSGQAFRKGGLNVENIAQATGGTADYIWYNISDNYAEGQGITLTTGNIIKKISLSMRISSGTGGDIVAGIKIYSDSSFTPLIGTSTSTITMSSMTSSFALYDFTFADLIVPSAFYFRLYVVSGTVSTSNYCEVNKSSSSAYSGGIRYSIDAGGIVTPKTDDLVFEINRGYSTVIEDASKKYKAVSTSNTYNKVQGVAQATVTANNSFSGVLSGKQNGYTGLTDGEIYYLKDDGTIGLTAGTTSVKVGRAISTTEINFVPPL